MKTPKFLFITMAFLCLFFYSEAQVRVYVGISPGTAAMVRGKSTQTTQIIKNGFFHVAATTEAEYKFKVIMTDGTETKVKSAIYTDTVKHATYLIVPRRYDLPNAYRDPEKRIYCNQTKSIDAGLVTDSCWLFKVINGKVNAYGYHPGVDYTAFLGAIQKGDGPIQKLTAENLAALINGDTEALESLKKGKFSDAIYIYNYNQKRLDEEQGIY